MSQPPPPPPPLPPEEPRFEARPSPRRPRVRRIPLGTAVRRTATISAIGGVLLFGGLTLQMERGQDPALGQSGKSDGGSSATTDATPASPTVVEQSDDSGVIAVQQQAPAPTPVQTSTS
jgi:hypothetical protein